MELLQHLIELTLHLDAHLYRFAELYGAWTYAALFLIIFCETGLVVTSFLPGDSLLFAAGALAAGGVLSVHGLVLLLAAAAVLGDAANYAVGRRVGQRAFEADIRLLNRSHLERTERFYREHGGKAIVLAWFVPIVRTFAPLVAGIGRMSYGRFARYNVGGGVVWVALFLYAGYFFGRLPVIQEHFALVVLALVALSLLPPVVSAVRRRFRGRDALASSKRTLPEWSGARA